MRAQDGAAAGARLQRQAPAELLRALAHRGGAHAGGASAGRPRPSSTTSISTPCAVRANRTTQVRAAACRTTLVTASTLMRYTATSTAAGRPASVSVPHSTVTDGPPSPEERTARGSSTAALANHFICCRSSPRVRTSRTTTEATAPANATTISTAATPRNTVQSGCSPSVAYGFGAPVGPVSCSVKALPSVARTT